MRLFSLFSFRFDLLICDPRDEQPWWNECHLKHSFSLHLSWWNRTQWRRHAPAHSLSSRKILIQQRRWFARFGRPTSDCFVRSSPIGRHLCCDCLRNSQEQCSTQTRQVNRAAVCKTKAPKLGRIWRPQIKIRAPTAFELWQREACLFAIPHQLLLQLTTVPDSVLVMRYNFTVTI